MKLTECGLRKELLAYAADNQERIQTFLSEWNERLAHGIGMPKKLWHDLFGSQLANSPHQKMIQSVSLGERVMEIYATVHVYPDNPFRTEFVYELVHEGYRLHFHLGDEEEILKLIEEEVNKCCSSQ